MYRPLVARISQHVLCGGEGEGGICSGRCLLPEGVSAAGVCVCSHGVSAPGGLRAIGGGGLPAPRGCLPRGGVCLGGVCIPACTEAGTPREQND